MSAFTPPIRVPRRAMFCVATIFGLSSTLQGVLLMRIAGEPSIKGDMIQLPVLNLAYWYVPALLAPIIMALAFRYQLGRVSWWKQVAVHGSGALVYGAIHTATMFAVRGALTWALNPPPMPEQRSFWQRVSSEGIRQFDWQLMTYLSLVGLAHALAYRRESERRELEASQLETRLIEAQLQSLQRQLHPHFLFNTLNTIAGLIRTNVNAADAMIDQLGDLLRMTLQTSNRQEVPLKQELEVLRKYLDIEQTRLGSRLRVADAHRSRNAGCRGAESAAATARRERRQARDLAAQSAGLDCHRIEAGRRAAGARRPGQRLRRRARAAHRAQQRRRTAEHARAARASVSPEPTISRSRICLKDSASR